MSFKEFNQERVDVVDELKAALDKRVGDDGAAYISDCIDRIREGSFKISVFGTYSHGKSTFLNALMQFDHEVLLIDERASTAAITVIRAPAEPGMENKARVLYTDGNEEVIEIDQIKDFTAKKRGEDGDTSDNTIEDDIKEVKVYVRSNLLDNGVEIIDTPGLNSAYEKHTDITMGIIDKSDATIVMFDFSAAGTQSEFDLLAMLSSNLRKAFLVVNKIDLAFDDRNSDERIDNVCEDLTEKLKSQSISLGERKLYPISAKYAFEGYCSEERKKKEELLDKSRIFDLVYALEDYLCSDQFKKDKILSPLTALKTALVRIIESNEETISGAKMGREELNKRVSDAKDKLTREEKETKDRAARLRKSIKTAFDTEKARLQNASDEIAEDVFSDIEKRKTEYSMNRFHARGGYAEELISALVSCWNNATQKMAEQISEIVQETFADTSNVDVQSIDASLTDIIRTSLSMESITSSEAFKVDFSEIRGLEEKRKAVVKHMEETAEEISRLQQDSARRIHEQQEYDSLRKEKRELESSIERLYNEKSKVKDIVVQQTVHRRVERTSGFGWILNWFDGGEKVTDHVFETFSEAADKERNSISEDICRKSRIKEEKERRLQEATEALIRTSSVDGDLTRRNKEYFDLMDEMSRLDLERDKAMDAIAQEQVLEEQKRLKKKVKTYIEDFSISTSKRLGEIQNECVKFVSGVVEQNNPLLQQLQREYEELLSLKTTGDEDRKKLIEEKTENNLQLSHVVEVITHRLQ